MRPERSPLKIWISVPFNTCLFRSGKQAYRRPFQGNAAEKKKLAILIDEYGGVSGMVTLEDLIEVIVGDIHEEYEEVEPEIIELEPGHVYSLSGSIALSDLKGGIPPGYGQRM